MARRSPPAPVGLDVAAARTELVDQIRKMPRSPPTIDLQSYVGSPVPVLGLSVPQVRSILKDFWRAHRELDEKSMNALARALWPGETFEEKVVAIGLLSQYEKILGDDSWTLADGWVDEATGWGLSDSLAAGPVAGMVRSKTARFREILRWTRATNPWRRRASTYALHRYVRAKDLDRPFQLLTKLLRDDEFWVQRAVGTWLRECWKVDPKRTEKFLLSHIRRGLPPVVVSVATERASKSFRARLRRMNPWKRAPKR